jgi:uncharacterized repeat protein (TIGR03803 family)
MEVHQIKAPRRVNWIHRAAIVLLSFAAAALPGVALAESGNYSIIHEFCRKADCTDGSSPRTALAIDQDGNLYGATSGVIFRLTPKSADHYAYNILSSSLAELGTLVNSPLILDTAGNVYGASLSGGGLGYGAVFELTPQGSPRAWRLKILYLFCPLDNCAGGYWPASGLTYAGAAAGQLYDGTSPLYGTTMYGGENNFGTVFELTPGKHHYWHEKAIYSFCSLDCPDGSVPEATPMLDSSGNIYGTTFDGGSNGFGTVYELSPQNKNWTETVLYSFCSVGTDCLDGKQPSTGVVMNSSGQLIGVTPYGGGSDNDWCVHRCGVLYMITPNGTTSQETILHNFCSQRECSDGSHPFDVPALDSQGNIFGTTSVGGDRTHFAGGAGTIFELSGSSFRVTHRFCKDVNCSDGSDPEGLSLNASGQLLGGAYFGGRSGQSCPPAGCGLIFSLTAE